MSRARTIYLFLSPATLSRSSTLARSRSLSRLFISACTWYLAEACARHERRESTNTGEHQERSHVPRGSRYFMSLLTPASPTAFCFRFHRGIERNTKTGTTAGGRNGCRNTVPMNTFGSSNAYVICMRLRGVATRRSRSLRRVRYLSTPLTYGIALSTPIPWLPFDIRRSRSVSPFAVPSDETSGYEKEKTEDKFSRLICTITGART